ncbi:MAG: glutaredoxin family protein [Gammaproteobacteria bacterium]|nr:glutaredoxin family protein [Gammaproteobacteria bacterium]
MKNDTLTFLICVAVVSALFSVEAFAQRTYRWVDEDGKVTYQDALPPDGALSVEEKNNPNYGPISTGDTGATIAASKYPVILYSISDCTGCDAARNYLKGRGVPFTEKNVEKNAVLQQEMREKVGALTVPTLVVGKKIMKGYMESLLAGELDQAGYPKSSTSKKESEEEGLSSSYGVP